jgi:hypothetical protein
MFGYGGKDISIKNNSNNNPRGVEVFFPDSYVDHTHYGNRNFMDTSTSMSMEIEVYQCIKETQV